ncbi:MAG: hypothetical protein K2L11_03730 [Muribaculaceae bacterium]|nr:hypothetical protein [Muribaculaceae bacterium]
MKLFCLVITLIILCINPLTESSRGVTALDFYDSPWISDTIDFSPARILLSVPESSVRHSREQIIKGHGKSIYFPLQYALDDHGIWHLQVVYIEHIVMTSYERLVHNDSIDTELWNSFNIESRGSRSYIRNGLYTRIDILESGIVIFYEDLDPNIAEIANRIIKSVEVVADKSIPILKERKKVTAI